MVLQKADKTSGVPLERFTPEPDPIFQIVPDPENYSIEIYLTVHYFVGIFLQKIPYFFIYETEL
jgi:hypothetical protein